MKNSAFRSGFVALLVLALLPWTCEEASAQRKKGRKPRASTSKEDGYTRIDLESPVQGTGFLYIPKGLPEDLPENPEAKRTGSEFPGLLVLLHGHGSTPKNMMRRPLADAHKDYMVSVQGPNPEGNGFSWDASAIPIINNLVRYILAHHPVNPDKVVLIGHSAGGTMVLNTFPSDPRLYAGMITIAAPMTPTSAHRKGRVCVFLGTADPNFSGAQNVQSALGGKHRWKCGCLIVLGGAEHNNLPSQPHLILAVDWCLCSKARGAEVEVPYHRGERMIKSAFHHIWIGFKGAEGWENPRGVKRSRGKARKLITAVAKYVPKGKAYFPFEALAHSDHEATFSLGGAISLKDLKALAPVLGEAAEALKPGDMSEVIETPKGYHLIWRKSVKE